MATLPAGAERSAGTAHVRFNSSAQALASRIVRQTDRRLTPLGVVHTHPGRLRHPSDGDFDGDSRWVGQLRGGEGVFGIGTADAPDPPDGQAGPGVSWQPAGHAQCLGPLRLSWYALADGDRAYRPLPVAIELGDDAARGLRCVWGVIEEHADRLDRLARQLARVRFEVVAGRFGPALAAIVPLPAPGEFARVVLEGKETRYFFQSGDDLFAADLSETRPDQGMFLLLAELAARA